MEDEFISNVVSLFENNKSSDILKLQIDNKSEIVHSLLWVWPSLENLCFIKDMVLQYNLNGITSIGCGSGLFEWLFQQTSGVEVIGIEVDEPWWSSKYAKYKFIPLNFTEMPPDEKLLPINHALLFCYFNHGEYFKEYIKKYKGSIVFIIGPGPGRGTLTNPAPFSADFGSTEWELIDQQEIKDTKDFIAVYKRSRLMPGCTNIL